MSRGRPLVPDQRTAVLAGIGLVVAGAYLLFDAYEKRGKLRPFALRLIPG